MKNELFYGILNGHLRNISTGHSQLQYVNTTAEGLALKYGQ